MKLSNEYDSISAFYDMSDIKAIYEFLMLLHRCNIYKNFNHLFYWGTDANSEIYIVQYTRGSSK